ncbi:MFS transporter [Bradyrhizobium sp. dw_78]|uniref:MFS transporter n=1 Tax=Bradyrhizobium sp. dw_78 TaxID=2719793 RepID=UPI00201BD6DF|nr:MFS transporter [Bradyrhizobium sp. dw_78]
MIAAPLTTEFALESSALGLLTSSYFLTFAAAQLPIGILLDRYGPRRVQGSLLLVAAIGAALFAVSDGFASLVLGRAMIGLGVAAALTAGLKATVLWFPADRVPLVNGWMVMLGALGSVTATTPSEWLLALIGWRGLFAWLAGATLFAAAAIYLLVPEAPRLPSIGNSQVLAGLKRIYSDPRFWRLAPLSATMIGTARSLQGLWAAPWFSDVEGLNRAALVDHPFGMAVALSLGALLLGMIATRLRKRNVDPRVLFAAVAALFITVQAALILRWPLPSYILWCFVAAVGATTVLSYASVAEYFPKELAGRANAALNVFHIGGLPPARPDRCDHRLLAARSRPPPTRRLPGRFRRQRHSASHNLALVRVVVRLTRPLAPRSPRGSVCASTGEIIDVYHGVISVFLDGCASSFWRIDG